MFQKYPQIKARKLVWIRIGVLAPSSANKLYELPTNQR